MEPNPFQPTEPTQGPSTNGMAPPQPMAGQVFGPSQPTVVPTAPVPVITPVITPTVPVVPVTTTPFSPNGAADRPLGVTQPASAVQPVMPGTEIQSFSDVSAKKLRRRLPGKLAIIICAAVLVLLGGGAAAYFGYYAPSQPDNLWKTAMSRTGQGYDKLTNYAVKQTAAKYKGATTKGTFKLSGQVSADGSFQGSSDGANGEFTGSLSTSGVKVDLDLRTIKSSTGTPDIYIKLDGLQGLGDLLGGADSPYASFFNELSGNWYFIDHSLIDQYAQTGASDMQITSADVNSLLTAIGGPSKIYVFTGDTQKSVFSIKQKIGKEKQDGRNTYHYKVGVNKANLKAYTNALCDSLKNDKIYKLLSGTDATVAQKSCKDTTDIDNIKDLATADVWVDTHTKLVHRVRFTDSANPNSYFDIGQDYQGGDQVPFFIDSYSKDSGTTVKIHVGLTLDMKANTLALNGTLGETGTDSSSNESGSFNMTVSPNNTPVKVEKPASSKTFIQLLDDLGLGELFGGGTADSGVASSAKDTERKTDINALNGQIEAFQTESGYYPTLADINSASWRAANMKGLDSAALKDPDGSAATLTASPAAHVYAYQVTPAGCDNVKVACSDYTLTATLDSGGTYTKQALDPGDSSLPASGGATVLEN